jgi:hypothetical protein
VDTPSSLKEIFWSSDFVLATYIFFQTRAFKGRDEFEQNLNMTCLENFQLCHQLNYKFAFLQVMTAKLMASRTCFNAYKSLYLYTHVDLVTSTTTSPSMDETTTITTTLQNVETTTTTTIENTETTTTPEIIDTTTTSREIGESTTTLESWESTTTLEIW